MFSHKNKIKSDFAEKKNSLDWLFCVNSVCLMCLIPFFLSEILTCWKMNQVVLVYSNIGMYSV